MLPAAAIHWTTASRALVEPSRQLPAVVQLDPAEAWSRVRERRAMYARKWPREHAKGALAKLAPSVLEWLGRDGLEPAGKDAECALLALVGPVPFVVDAWVALGGVEGAVERLAVGLPLWRGLPEVKKARREIFPLRELCLRLRAHLSAAPEPLYGAARERARGLLEAKHDWERIAAAYSFPDEGWAARVQPELKAPGEGAVLLASLPTLAATEAGFGPAAPWLGPVEACAIGLTLLARFGDDAWPLVRQLPKVAHPAAATVLARAKRPELREEARLAFEDLPPIPAERVAALCRDDELVMAWLREVVAGSGPASDGARLVLDAAARPL